MKRKEKKFKEIRREMRIQIPTKKYGRCNKCDTLSIYYWENEIHAYTHTYTRTHKLVYSTQRMDL